MKEFVFKNFLVNIRALFTTNIRKSINQNAAKVVAIEDTVERLGGDLEKLKQGLYYLNVLDYYARHEEEAGTYAKELEYLRENGSYRNFPYQEDCSIQDVVLGVDSESKLPYVVHHDKKLFFPSNYTEDVAAAIYLNYMKVEKLLGVGDTEGTPHQYQSPAIHVSEGDVVFDIGAAEGLFALDQIEKASRVFVVESDAQWITPLRKTFAPYGDKVTVIQKFISTADTENTLSLKKLLSDVDFSSAFVKMDIEGYELPAIASAMDVLKEKQGTKIAAAAYHRQHDAEELKTIFDKLGYQSEFSSGYMLFHQFDIPMPPYFRKGMIRAKR